MDERTLQNRFCPTCDLKATCAREGTGAKLSPLCLDGIASAVLEV